MILRLDNYASFTYNLVQELGEISGADIRVVRNDVSTPEELLASNPQAVVISPGPGRPEAAGITMDLIRAAADRPLLGICLGHQALGAVHGAQVVRAPEPVHGKTSAFRHQARGLFAGRPDPLEATRYHSLVLDRSTVGPQLGVSAWTDAGLVMAREDRQRPPYGIQFHPESYLTREGKALLARFLKLAGVELCADWACRMEED